MCHSQWYEVTVTFDLWNPIISSVSWWIFTTFEDCPSQRFWDIVFTRRRRTTSGHNTCSHSDYYYDRPNKSSDLFPESVLICLFICLFICRFVWHFKLLLVSNLTAASGGSVPCSRSTRTGVFYILDSAGLRIWTCAFVTRLTSSLIQLISVTLCFFTSCSRCGRLTHRPAALSREPSRLPRAAGAGQAVPSPASSSPGPAPGAAPRWQSIYGGSRGSHHPRSPRTWTWNRIWACGPSPPEWNVAQTDRRCKCRRWRARRLPEDPGPRQTARHRRSEAPRGSLHAPGEELLLPGPRLGRLVGRRTFWCRRQCLWAELRDSRRKTIKGFKFKFKDGRRRHPLTAVTPVLHLKICDRLLVGEMHPGRRGCLLSFTACCTFL